MIQEKHLDKIHGHKKLYVYGAIQYIYPVINYKTEETSKRRDFLSVSLASIHFFLFMKVFIFACIKLNLKFRIIRFR